VFLKGTTGKREAIIASMVATNSGISLLTMLKTSFGFSCEQNTENKMQGEVGNEI